MRFWLDPFKGARGIIRHYRRQAQREGWYEVIRQFMQTKVVKNGGELVGIDGVGNKYYENLADVPGQTRWVIYAQNNRIEATLVPLEWSQWLHYVSDTNPATHPELFKGYEWMLPNMPQQLSRFGYEGAYSPPGYYSRSLLSTQRSTSLYGKYANQDEDAIPTASGAPTASGSVPDLRDQIHESTGRTPQPKDDSPWAAFSAGRGRVQGIYQPWHKESKDGRYHPQEIGTNAQQVGNPTNPEADKQSAGAGTMV